MYLQYREIHDGRITTVIGCDPHIRSCYVEWSHDSYKIYRLTFPYLIFYFNYQIVPKGYIYPGYNSNGCGLRLFMSHERITSFDSLVFPSFTEHASGGAVCLNHSYDGSLFPTEYSLISNIIGLWSKSIHKIFDQNLLSNWLTWTLDEWKKESEKIVYSGFGQVFNRSVHFISLKTYKFNNYCPTFKNKFQNPPLKLTKNLFEQDYAVFQ